MSKKDDLRDAFAGQALMALINRPSEYAEPIDAMGKDGPRSTFLRATDACILNYAKLAYRFADAMLLARKPPPSGEP